MGFSHVQGGEADQTGNASSWTLTLLPSNPTPGDLVIVAVCTFWDSFSLSSVKDSAGNSYQLTHSSPYAWSGTGTLTIAYLLSAPANATKSFTITFSGNMEGSAWAEEFSYSGTASYDTDYANNVTISGTSFNNISITPAGAGELLYALGYPYNGPLTAPAAGATLGAWTGGAGGISSFTDGDVEYILSGASGATDVDFTDSYSGDTAAAIIAAFKFSGAAAFQPDEDFPMPPALGGPPGTSDQMVTVWE